MKGKLLIAALLSALLTSRASALAAPADEAEGTDDRAYVLTDESGVRLTSRCGQIFAGDEYISGGNLLYVVTEVDDESCVAVARLAGEEPSEAEEAFSALSEEARKRIAMYSTHSDESYIPGDGDSSLLKNAGIYDVGEALKKHLEELGVDVSYSHETFFPHDAGAYRRSRAVAASLLKSNPDALIDIHRDGVSADEYETTVDGKDTSKVRLFVGRTNANAAENRAFAKKLKRIADEKYPGLVKDIFIGKGNYNQDLYPEAILLEFGTHEIEKDKAVDSTKYMANVLYDALYDDDPTSARSDAKGAAKGVGWLIGAAVLAAAVFAAVSTGSFRGAGAKMKRTMNEVTGGAFSGKKRKE